MGRQERKRKAEELKQEFIKKQQKKKTEDEREGAMSEDLGDLLVEDGEEMFEALSQMPDTKSSSSPKRRKSIPSCSILPKKSPRTDLARVSSSRLKNRNLLIWHLPMILKNVCLCIIKG